MKLADVMQPKSRKTIKAWTWGPEGRLGYGHFDLGVQFYRQPTMFSRGVGPMYGVRLALIWWGAEVQVYRPFPKYRDERRSA